MSACQAFIKCYNIKSVTNHKQWHDSLIIQSSGKQGAIVILGNLEPLSY